MGNLLSHFCTFLLKFNDIVPKIKQYILHPRKFDEKEVIRFAPVIVKWLQTASDERALVHPEERHLVVLLQSAFQTGSIGEIYRISSTYDEALDTMLMVSPCPLNTLPRAVLITYPRLAIYPPEWTTLTILWRARSSLGYSATWFAGHLISPNALCSTSNRLIMHLIPPMNMQNSTLEIMMGVL